MHAVTYQCLPEVVSDSLLAASNAANIYTGASGTRPLTSRFRRTINAPFFVNYSGEAAPANEVATKKAAIRAVLPAAQEPTPWTPAHDAVRVCCIINCGMMRMNTFDTFLMFFQELRRALFGVVVQQHSIGTVVAPPPVAPPPTAPTAATATKPLSLKHLDATAVDWDAIGAAVR